MCQCLAARSPSINQVTKHAEFPQTLYIGNVVVEMPVVRQRKVPQIRTASNTVEIPPLMFVGRVMEAPVIMQMRQCRLSRSRRASRSVYTNRPSINQGDQACRDPTWKTAGAVRRQSSGCAGTVTDDDSSEESDRGSDRSSIFDGLMAKQEDPPEMHRKRDPQVDGSDLAGSSWRQGKSARKWARYRGWRKEGHDSWSWAGDGRSWRG